MLFVSVDSVERLLIVIKKNFVSLPLVPVRIKGIQLTRTNLDFIFRGKNLFLSIRLIQVFDNRTGHFSHFLDVCIRLKEVLLL